MVSSSGYDAFLSYSHVHDAVLAPALQTGLERFAKPWYSVRAVRIFRDSANLAANPALWGSIEDALDSSQWFILLASADAAKSAWVNREVEWWLAHRSQERLLVVATSPGMAWERQKGDWGVSAPVPSALRRAFADEPLWVDLSDLRLDNRRPQVPSDRLADLAAAIRGMPKDAIVGEHLRQHRRAMRLARGAVVALTTLTVLAVAAAAIAVGQRDTARTQARLATSREWAALAVSNLSTNLEVAQLLAAAAFRMDDNPQTEGALLQAVAASPHLVRFLQVGSEVTALATSADSNAVVAGTADGHLVWFSLSSGRRAEVATGKGRITAVGVSGDGGAVVATDGSGAVFWPVGVHRAAPIDTGHQVSSVAISPSGNVTAVLDGAGTPSASVLVRDSHSDVGARIGVSDLYTSVAFPSDSVMTAIGPSSAKEWSLPGLKVLSRFSAVLLPAGNYTLGTSVNGEYAGYSKYGVIIWSTKNYQNSRIFPQVAPKGVGSDLEIAPDGRSVALLASGTIYVAQAPGSPQAQTASDAIQLTGGGDVTAVRFLGGGDRLVSSSGTSLELWDLRQTSRLGQSTGISIPDSGTVGTPPSLMFSPDGRWLTIVGRSGFTFSTYHTGPRFTLSAGPANLADTAGPLLWRGDQLLTFRADSSVRLDLTDESGRILASWSGTRSAGISSLRLLPGGQQLAAVDGHGGVRIYNLKTMTVRQVYADQSVLKNNTLELYQSDISPGGSGAVMNEWNFMTSPLTPVRVLYVDLRTGISHVIGSGGAEAAVFTSNRLLVQRTTGTLEIWDLAGRHLLQTVPGSAGFTPNLAVSPSGTLVARLRDDGTASITDLTTGQIIADFSLPLPSDSVATYPWDATTLAFTPDGKELLSATSGGEMMRWSIASSALIQNVCAVVGRNLTAAEWREYVQTDPPPDLSCTEGSGGTLR